MCSGLFFAYYGVFFVYILIFLLIVGCHSDKQSSIVARVGTEKISISDLREFESSIDDSLSFSL